MTFNFNGQEFTGDSFEIRAKVLYIDGHPVMDLRPETEEISISGEGNVIVDKDVIIYGTLIGNITANRVLIDGVVNGNIKAEKVLDIR